MKKRIYLSHPYGGFRENREKAAPLAEEGVDDETILILAVALMNDCDGVLFAPGWKRSRGCRYEHFRLRHSHKDNKYFKAEIPAEVEAAAVHWYGKHHIEVRRWAA